MRSCSTAAMSCADCFLIWIFRRDALPNPRRPAAASRRHGAPRCGRLGLRARRGWLGVDIIENCEVKGFIREKRPHHRCGNEPRYDPRGTHRDFGSRPHLAPRGDGWLASAGREPPAAGLRDGADQALRRSRDFFRRRALLYFSVGQGRSGLWRAYRRLQQLHAARPVRQGPIRRGMRGGAHPVCVAAAIAAPLGRDTGHDAGRQPVHRPHTDCGPIPQRGLVLSGIQGDAGGGLVLRAHDRQ
jgi:hypothetical protein